MLFPSSNIYDSFRNPLEFFRINTLIVGGIIGSRCDIIDLTFRKACQNISRHIPNINGIIIGSRGFSIMNFITNQIS